MAEGMRASRRDEVLHVLDESDQAVSIVAIASDLNLHPNTVRFHLERLLAAGSVERITADSGLPGRPAQLFRRVRVPDATTADGYRVLAEALVADLVDAPDTAQAALAVGRRWGSRQAAAVDGSDPVRGLVDVLGQAGFGAAPGDEPDRVDVCHCPFPDLARTAPEVVCSIHLGIIQGALAQWQAGATVDGLRKCEHPAVCRAQLRPVPGAPDAAARA